MLFKIDKTEQNRVTASMDVTSGERVTLSFSEDGKEPWTSFNVTGKILHKILCDDREAREMVHDPDVQYKRMNGHSFLAVDPKHPEE